MSSDITLSAAVRQNLLALQGTNSLLDTVQNRLSTGKTVNSALDYAVKFFAAKSLSDRAADFSNRKSDIDQALSSIQAASNGLDSVDKILQQLQGIVNTVRTADATTRGTLTSQFDTLLVQLNQLVGDASYQGVNLINTSATARLSVQFSTVTTATLTIDGNNVQASALFSDNTSSAASTLLTDVIGAGTSDTTNVAGGFSTVSAYGNSALDYLNQALSAAITKERAVASTLGNNNTFLQTRLDFTNNFQTTLQSGSDKLTLADVNQEGANLVSLQTRQQLSLQALSIAGQNEKAVLQLFR